MSQVFSLAHLTALSLAPPELVSLASRTGYRKVGLRLIPTTPDTPAYALMDDPGKLRDTKQRMADTGIGVLDIEFVRLTPDIDMSRMEPFLATGAELGAGYVICGPYDPEPHRLAATLGKLADLAAAYGLWPLLEFFPWTNVNSLAAARTIVDAAARPNCGILVDTLHFARTPGTLEELAATPARLLPFVHLSDCPAEIPATVEGLLHNARAERLPPGEGELDLIGILDAMPAGIPIALEVPMTRLTAELGPERVALHVREAAARVLAGVRGRRAEPAS